MWDIFIWFQGFDSENWHFMQRCAVFGELADQLKVG
jgi:hypothetical protein